MSNTENMPLKIFHAFEDLYFEEGKGKIFDEIFSRYFTYVEIEKYMDLYDVLTVLSTEHRQLFEQMVKELKEHSLIND